MLCLRRAFGKQEKRRCGAASRSLAATNRHIAHVQTPAPQFLHANAGAMSRQRVAMSSKCCTVGETSSSAPRNRERRHERGLRQRNINHAATALTARRSPRNERHADAGGNQTDRRLQMKHLLRQPRLEASGLASSRDQTSD